MNFGVRKLKSLGYHVVLFEWSYVPPFWYNIGLWHTVTQTNTQTNTQSWLLPRRASSARVKIWHQSVILIFSERKLAFTFAICYRRSVCRLSVKFVHPTQPVEIFGNFSSIFPVARIDTANSVQNLTTLGSAVPVIWLEPQNFVMGHMTWPGPYWGQFVVCRLWLAHSTGTSNL